jgi:hypothetical protein
MTFQQYSSPINLNNAETIRRNLTRYCLKSMSLEGVEADSETLAQLELLDSGKITMEEFVIQMCKKAGAGKNAASNT